MPRESLYRPEYCDLVIELGRNGASKTKMAAQIGVARKTLDTWATLHDEFGEALELALTHSEAWWEEKGEQGMFMGKAFNASVWTFTMECRFHRNYSPVKRKEISGPDGGPITQAVELTDDELRNQIADNQRALSRIEAEIARTAAPIAGAEKRLDDGGIDSF